MPQSFVFLQTTFSLPSIRERNWGNVQQDFYDAIANVLSDHISETVIVNSTVAASATLTQTGKIHRMTGDGGAITLDATTAIADGVVDGQLLILEGVHATSTVSVPDAANTDIGGTIILGTSNIRFLTLRWHTSRSLWVMVSSA